MFSDVSDVVEAWIADRKLSRRNLAFLNTVFTQGLDSISADEPMGMCTANGLFCEELELPRGSSVLEVIASLLDHLTPRDCAPSRLVEVQEQLEEWDYYSRLDDGTPGSEGYRVPVD